VVVVVEREKPEESGSKGQGGKQEKTRQEVKEGGQ
jgi:hypothetical protein